MTNEEKQGLIEALQESIGAIEEGDFRIAQDMLFGAIMMAERIPVLESKIKPNPELLWH